MSNSWNTLSMTNGQKFWMTSWGGLRLPWGGEYWRVLMPKAAIQDIECDTYCYDFMLCVLLRLDFSPMLIWRYITAEVLVLNGSFSVVISVWNCVSLHISINCHPFVTCLILKYILSVYFLLNGNLVKDSTFRISDLSSSEEIFNEQPPYYNQALAASSSFQKIKYNLNKRLNLYISQILSTYDNHHNHNKSPRTLYYKSRITQI